MKRRIKTFRDFLLEQESKETTTTTGGISSGVETERQAKSRIAKSLVQSIFGDVGEFGSIDSQIKNTKEVKERLPYKGCGANEPYPLKKVPITCRGLKDILYYLDKNGIGDYKRTLEDLHNKRAVIIGLRNKISTKKESINQDRFIDGLYFISKDAAGDDMFIPYQITTSPSLAYYGKKPLNPDGTGIKLPGETLYYLKEADIGHGKYKMLIEGEPINVGRYPEGTTKFETYKPTEIFQKQNCGMHIHRSSKERGICVGPWSAGCQVFADGNEYDEFIRKAEGSTTNNGRFFYALVEYDSIPPEVLNDALKTQEQLDKEKPGDLAAAKRRGDGGTSFDDNDYADFAEQLYKALKGEGTDEDTIYNILGFMNSKEDWNKLNKAFGARDEMTLTQWLMDDLDSDEIEKVNSIIGKFGQKIQA